MFLHMPLLRNLTGKILTTFGPWSLTLLSPQHGLRLINCWFENLAVKIFLSNLNDYIVLNPPDFGLNDFSATL